METIDESTECMRPEQVNKWHNSKINNEDVYDYDDDEFVTICIAQQTSARTCIVVVLDGEDCLSI